MKIKVIIFIELSEFQLKLIATLNDTKVSPYNVIELLIFTRIRL